MLWVVRALIPWQAYNHLGEAAPGEGPLEPNVRALIKPGMAAAVRPESAVGSHVQRALDAAATLREIEHAIVLGVTTLGFPGMAAAFTWANKALEDHS